MASAKNTCYAVNMKKAFFIGIGGIGMSALASTMQAKGWEICGSDQNSSQITEDLKKNGATIYPNHKGDHINTDTTLVIYSEAIPQDNPELAKAKLLQIKTITYARALADLANDHNLVLITGTHGKTTTTGMLTKIALETELEPTVVIGGKMKELDNKNFRIGESDLWIVEGCEYRKSFLNFKPNILVLTNLDVDHLDYYETEQNYFDAFVEMIKNVKENGIIVFAEDDERSAKAVNIAGAQRRDLRIHTFSQENIRELELKLLVPGKHNRANALAAVYCAEALGVPASKAVEAVNKFTGTWRRLEYIGEIEGAKLYDDYAHHPIEIKATLQALRELYPTQKICCVFQPHQLSRTVHFLHEFGESFSDADTVVVSNIYKVREKTDHQNTEAEKTLSEADLMMTIGRTHANVVAGGSLLQTEKLIKQLAPQHDIVIIMGAGDIAKLRKLV